MARKKQDEESGGSWMDTYGDMVTLLLTFFIVLYSMSSIEQDKWSEIVKAFNVNGKNKVDQIVLTVDGEGESPATNNGDGDPTGQGLTEFDEFYTAMVEYLEENHMSENVSVSQGDGDGDDTDGTNKENIYLQFQDYITFEPDTAVLVDSSYAFLDFFGEQLLTIEDDLAIIIIKGHTATYDSSTVDARILSGERASAISNYLEDKFELSPQKLIPIGLANLYPIADNKTEDGRGQNRRVEISIIGKNSALVQDGELLKTLIGVDFGLDTETNTFSDAVTDNE